MHGAIGVGAFATLVICYGGPVALKRQPADARALPTFHPQVPSLVTCSGYEMAPTIDGRMRIEATFVDGKPIDIPALGGMTHLPPQWRAHVTVTLATTTTGTIAVTPIPGDPNIAPLHLGAGSIEHRFATDNCDSRDQPLGLRLAPAADWPANARCMALGG